MKRIRRDVLECVVEGRKTIRKLSCWHTVVIRSGSKAKKAKTAFCPKCEAEEAEGNVPAVPQMRFDSTVTTLDPVD